MMRQSGETRRHAFTLLEVLVAITVLAVLMPAVLACFFTGLRAYRKCYETANLVADARGTMALLQADLSRAAPVDMMSNTYDPKKLSFIVQDPRSACQRRITYSLEAGILMRESQPLAAGDVAYEKAELAAGVSLLAFQYWLGQTWESKAKAPEVPQAVRIQLGLDRPDSTAYYENCLLFPAIKATAAGGGS